MINYLKSNTIQSAALLTITQLPQLGDPIWSALSETGVPAQFVAITKVSFFVLGIIGVVWGRSKAKGPL